MRKEARFPLVIAGAAIALLLAGAGLAIWAGNDDDEDGEGQVVEFAGAAVFFEYNSTDQDLGLHIFFDAPAWKDVEVQAPGKTEDDDDHGTKWAWGSRFGHGGWRGNGHNNDDDGDALFVVENGGALRGIGSTEVFTESGEPPLCPDEDCTDEEIEAAIEAFQSRFPEGTYEFAGKTLDRHVLEGEAELSWELPEPVEILDAQASFPTISWTESEAVAYQIIVDAVVEGAGGEEIALTQSTDLPAGVTTLETSPQFAQQIERAAASGTLLQLKVEVIAVGSNGNKTITEETLFEAGE